MPLAPFRACPRCGRLVRGGGVCGDCERRWDHERGNSAERLYGGPWRAYRPIYLAVNKHCGDRDGLPSTDDSLCREKGLRVPATVVDHIRPHRGDLKRFWDRGNHQAPCETCHNRKRQREAEAAKGRGASNRWRRATR